MDASFSSASQDGPRVAPASRSGHHTATTGVALHPSLPPPQAAAVTSSSSPSGMCGATTEDFGRWDATTILEALLWMSGAESSGSRWKGQPLEVADTQVNRSCTPLESSTEALNISNQPEPPHSATVRPTTQEDRGSSQAPTTSELSLPAALQQSSCRTASSSSPPAPFEQEDATVSPHDRTPTQCRNTSAHAHRIERYNKGEVQSHTRAGTGPTAGVDSTGLVSSTFPSQSRTAASSTAPQEREAPPVAAVRRIPSTSRHAPAPASATAVSGPVSAPQSSAVSTEAGGALWQQAFAAHADKLLRETQQQVEELRRYQQKAAREAQRADALVAANRTLEMQLAEADAKRAEEHAAHEHAASALSQQILRLEETLGVMRRTKLEVQQQLKGAQAAAAEQEAVHQRELRGMRSAFESEVERMRTEQHLQAQQWRHEQQRLEEKLLEWESAGVTVFKQQRQLVERCAELERQHEADATALLHAVPTPAYKAEEERAAAVPRVDAATSTGMLDLPAAQAIPPDNDDSSYTRVHPDVLTQQQLREKTMLSELSIADARFQHERKQRRLAEERVAQLLEQNEQLREALSNAETSAVNNTERVPEAAMQTIAVALAAKPTDDTDNASHETCQPRVEHEPGTPQERPQERPQEHTKLQESATLVEWQRRQPRRETERWAAVRSAVSAVLHVAGLHDGQDTDKDAAAADTSNLCCLGEVLDDSSEASFNATLAALDKLASTLRSQQEAAAAEEAVPRRQPRLSTLEEALHVAQANNEAHIASLEATEAQLRESRQELASWQRGQNSRAARQGVQDAMLRAAEVQLKHIMGVVQRALREYAPHLYCSLSRLSSAGDDAGDDAVTAGSQVARKKSDRALKRRSWGLPASAESLDGDEGSEEHASMLPETANAVPLWASEGDASAGADFGDLPQDAFIVPEVACDGGKVDGSDATADSEGESRRRRPSTRTASLSLSSTATRITLKSTNAGSAASTSGMRRNMKMLEWGLLKLLTAWRNRQHTLVEARKALQRQLADETAKSAALREENREATIRHQQQLHLSRASAQRCAHQLEQVQEELNEAKQQHMRDSAQAQQKEAERERERDALRRRLRVSEEQLSRAEQALVEADVDHNSQHASQETLKRVLNDATAARDRLERRQADLCVHIEDLEARLLVAERTQTGLHTLITTSVAFIVRLLADHQQLQAHYQALRSLAWADAQALKVIERVLESFCLERDALATTPTGEKRLLWSTEAESGAPAGLAGAVGHSATSATPLRIAGIAVRAVIRLSRLLAARQRLQRNPNMRCSDGVYLARSAAPVESASLQPLLLALSSAFTSGAAAPVCHSAVASSHSSLLWRYIARPDSCVLPVVRLPAPLELAAVAHNEAAEEEAGAHAEGHTVRFDIGSAHEAEETHIGAHHNQQQQLVRLLTVAQIDMQASATRHLCAGVVDASSASARTTAELLQLAHVRHALSAMLVKASGQNGPSTAPSPSIRRVPGLRPLLPGRLAALLQSHLEQAATQCCERAELHTLVQRLVQQKEKLVSALKLRTSEHDAASAEIQSLTSQLQLYLAERVERTAVQERLVETRTSLLQERKLRRAAEERLAELQQARLQWLSDQEQYKREVYSLNMELANTSVGSVPPAGEAGCSLLSAHSGVAGPASATSALSIQVDHTTMSDAACRPAAPPLHVEAPADSVVDGSARHEEDRARGCHSQVCRTPACATQVDHQGNSENAYYYKLLRNSHARERDARPGQQHRGNRGARMDAHKRSGAHGDIPPLPTLQYRPRTNLPILQDLAENVSPDATRSAGATARADGRGFVQPPSSTGASMLNGQRTHQSPSCAAALSPTASSMATLTTTTPAPQPLLRLADTLELYVPGVARQHETSRRQNDDNFEERRLGATAEANPSTRKTIGGEGGGGVVRHVSVTATPSSFAAGAPAPELHMCTATPPPRSTTDTDTQEVGRRRLTHEQPQRSAAYSVEPSSTGAATYRSTAPTSFSVPPLPLSHPPSYGRRASASSDTRAEALTLSREEFALPGRPSEAGGVTDHVSGPLYFNARSAR
ncbi:hypothetical protein, conserved [Leishmania tarentolae]|uniref:Uncharacterized protein n=1 Tax=Leishmania tarentolae TaxID=5689 RepID=A0A640KEK0_LEITA|nr:hypothetical protein, conserved [Leishmania tarentolae]